MPSCAPIAMPSPGGRCHHQTLIQRAQTQTGALPTTAPRHRQGDEADGRPSHATSTLQVFGRCDGRGVEQRRGLMPDERGSPGAGEDRDPFDAARALPGRGLEALASVRSTPASSGAADDRKAERDARGRARRPMMWSSLRRTSILSTGCMLARERDSRAVMVWVLSSRRLP